MTIEELLKEIPYSVSISKVIETDKFDPAADNYCIELLKYSGMWQQIKDFYGNDLQALLEEALNWCNGNNTK